MFIIVNLHDDAENITKCTTTLFFLWKKEKRNGENIVVHFVMLLQSSNIYSSHKFIGLSEQFVRIKLYFFFKSKNFNIFLI